MSEIIQGSDAWKLLRCGRVTASRVADVIAKTKTGWGASRANYAAELIAERLTGTPAEGYQNAAMAWGTEKEPDARMAYEFRHDVAVREVGFVIHPTIPMSGASPDGLIEDDGLIEIKAPNTNTHLETLTGRAVPGKYLTQIQWQLAATGRSWCDYVSFDPRLPESMRMFVARVHRDDAQINELEHLVRGFLAEIDAKVSELTKLYGGEPVIKVAA